MQIPSGKEGEALPEGKGLAGERHVNWRSSAQPGLKRNP
jgi:hypothetical protein